MQITKASEYGVLGLMHLAKHDPNTPVMIEDISEEENIPRSFLGKIFQSLVKAGIICSTRGASGGFYLIKKPEQISLLEIIEAIEGKIVLQQCLDEPPRCESAKECALCRVFGQAQSNLKSTFSKVTLAQLMEHQTELKKHNKKKN
jgi:Rrf2 family protein